VSETIGYAQQKASETAEAAQEKASELTHAAKETAYNIKEKAEELTSVPPTGYESLGKSGFRAINPEEELYEEKLPGVVKVETVKFPAPKEKILEPKTTRTSGAEVGREYY
jgi:hypothetical protein